MMKEKKAPETPPLENHWFKTKPKFMVCFFSVKIAISGFGV